VDEVPRIIAALPTGTQRSLYITEFGVRGVNRRFDEPGYALDGTPIGDTPEQGMQIAWFMMEAINHGYVATVQWDCYVAWYDRLMSYGLIDDVRHRFKTRPAYDVLRLFTHTTKPGWRAVKVDGDAENFTVAATRSDDGDVALYLMNRSDREGAMRVQFGKPAFATQWQLGKLSRTQKIQPDSDGVIEITIPSKSLVALTTLRPDL
jgi:hypothetical protein